MQQILDEILCVIVEKHFLDLLQLKKYKLGGLLALLEDQSVVERVYPERGELIMKLGGGGVFERVEGDGLLFLLVPFDENVVAIEEIDQEIKQLFFFRVEGRHDFHLELGELVEVAFYAFFVLHQPRFQSFLLQHFGEKQVYFLPVLLILPQNLELQKILLVLKKPKEFVILQDVDFRHKLVLLFFVQDAFFQLPEIFDNSHFVKVFLQKNDRNDEIFSVLLEQIVDQRSKYLFFEVLNLLNYKVLSFYYFKLCFICFSLFQTYLQIDEIFFYFSLTFKN